VGTPEFGHQTERRRKRVVRLVVAGLAVTLLVIGAFYRWKAAPEDKRLAIPQALPSNVNQQLSGYSYTRTDNGRRIFTIHAARSVAFKQNGETVLNDVWVEVFGRSGNRHDLLRTRQCTYDRVTGALFAEGKVEVELNAPPTASDEKELAQPLELPILSSSLTGRNRLPIYLETSHLSFVRQGSEVVSDAPVKFRVGMASGTAEGLVYATRDDWLELKRNVSMEVQPLPGPAASTPLRVMASRLRFDKATGTATLWGPVEVTRQERRVTAEGGKIFLNAQNRITAAELAGDVKVHVPTGTGVFEGSAQLLRALFQPEGAQLRSLTAEGDVRGDSKDGEQILHLASQRFEMNFSGQPPRPSRGSATGNVRLTAETLEDAGAGTQQPAAPKGSLSKSQQELTAEGVQFEFTPHGRLLREASTTGAGKLVVVPNDPKVGERVITADPFVMDFDALGRPAILRGLSQAHITFMPPPNAPKGSSPAESSSDRLQATLDPVNQTLRTVDQTGDFRFRQGDRRAYSERAQYAAASDGVTLTGQPRVEDQETRARADQIRVDLGNDTAEGLGHVQATHLEDSAKKPGAKRSDPTNVVADRMIARRDSQFVHYEGHVRVWHGQDVIESSSIDVYKAERRVRSGARVLTSFLQPAAESPEKGGKSRAGNVPVPVTIRADDLEYFDEGRKASYRGHVQLETENATLRADRLDVYFSSKSAPGSSEVERAVADGHVTVVQPARRATGEHAEYFAAPGKILVTGGPPTLYDAEKGFTTGRQLTFFLRDDTIFLDGGEESPTLSRHRIPQ
jgi:lipopolysaccharide export system protein LptA